MVLPDQDGIYTGSIYQRDVNGETTSTDDGDCAAAFERGEYVQAFTIMRQLAAQRSSIRKVIVMMLLAGLR